MNAPQVWQLLLNKLHYQLRRLSRCEMIDAPYWLPSLGWLFDEVVMAFGRRITLNELSQTGKREKKDCLHESRTHSVFIKLFIRYTYLLRSVT